MKIVQSTDGKWRIRKWDLVLGWRYWNGSDYWWTSKHSRWISSYNTEQEARDAWHRSNVPPIVKRVRL